MWNLDFNVTAQPVHGSGSGYGSSSESESRNRKIIQLIIFCIFFWSKIAIYLSFGLHKGRPSYRGSLQPSIENIQNFKRWNLLSFLFFWVNFALLNPDKNPDCESRFGSRDPIESGSTTLGQSKLQESIPLLVLFKHLFYYLAEVGVAPMSSARRYSAT